jgi:hypothetical protein
VRDEGSVERLGRGERRGERVYVCVCVCEG